MLNGQEKHWLGLLLQ